MKKILTLFAMLLVTASTLLAQTPKLSYQMVVRDQNNNLVVNTNVAGVLSIYDTNDVDNTEAWFTMEFNQKTNLNGMLSLIIQCPEAEENCMSDVRWDEAKIRVVIENHDLNIDIDETMKVLPVPYALIAKNQDVNLTTAQIVKYLKQVDTADFEAIIAAMYGNSSQDPTLEKYLVDTVLNYIKANKTAVRNMMLNWLSQMNANDLDTVYKIFNANTEVKNKVNEMIVNFFNTHRSDVKEVVLDYIGQTTRGDIKAVFDAVKDNDAFDTIADVIADTAIKYIEANPEKVRDLVQYYINKTTTGEVDELQSHAKTHNPIVYDYTVAIIDSMIQHYLDSLHYINNADCQEANICSLLENIETLENSEFVQCPKMSAIDTTRVPAQTPEFTYVYTLKNTFDENIFNVNMHVGPGPDSLIYVFSYPNTTSKADTLYATYHDEGDGVSSMNLTLAFDSLLEKGQVINVYAVARARCMEILKSQTVTFNFPKRCPRITQIANTSPVAKADLQPNQGVMLSATVNYDYPEMIVGDSLGFVVIHKDYDGTTIKRDTIMAKDTTGSKKILNNVFYGHMDMSYCSMDVQVFAFLKCTKQAQFIESEDTLKFHVRGPLFNITTNSPDSTYRAFADSIVLTARNLFVTSDYGTHSIEYFLKKYASKAQEYGFQNPTYHWADSASLSDSIYKIAPDSNHAYVGWMEMSFLGTTCKVYDTIAIKYKPYICGDSINLGDTNALKTPHIKFTTDPADTTYRTSLHAPVVLSAEGFYLDKVLNRDTSVNVMKEQHSYGSLIDSVTYNWYNSKGVRVKKGSDTIHVTTKKDTVLYAEVIMKLKNDSSCYVIDSIKVKYQHECGDSLRTKENVYATVDINGACWTKSNMRDTLNFVHGEQTGNISNGVAKYYYPSTLITFSKEQLGLLYNHDGAKSVCPKGWHLPDTTEWQDMLHYVDTVDHNPAPNSFKKVNDTLWRTTYIYKIGAMNQAPGDIWPYCTGGSSTIKFDAYPAGVRQINTLVPQDGLYTSMPLGAFWTKTESPRTDLPQNAKKKYYSFYLYPETSEEENKYVYRADVNMIIAMSVRCVKGPEEDEPVAETCPSTVTDRNNNQIEYATVKIGDQCWMKENLRTIPTTGTYTNPGGFDNSDTIARYGLLYNKVAANSEICPEGWRVPTQADFTTLINNVESCNNEPNYKNKALAVDENVWKQYTYSNECMPSKNYQNNNASRFSARPAGQGYPSGSSFTYDFFSSGACIWAVSSDKSSYYCVWGDSKTVDEDVPYGVDSRLFSIRCIKESLPQTQTQEP